MTRLTAWGTRLLLGLLFLWGIEILLWIDTLNRPLADIGLRAVGCVLLASIVLDVAVRYRIRDIYDSMAIIGGYALLLSLLITPQVTLNDFPRTLLTRVLGGQGLVGLVMFGVFMVLTNGRDPRLKRLLLPATAWVGFYWGVWMRWSPELNGLFPVISLPTMAQTAGLLLIPILVVWVLLRRPVRQLHSEGLKLNLVEWLIVTISLIILFIVQGAVGAIDLGMVLAVGLLLVVSWAIIWFRRADKGKTLFEAHFPTYPLAWGWVIAMLTTFVAVTAFAYALPLAGTPDINQLWLMEVGFAGVGTLWYPLIAAVIAFRGVDAQVRTNEL